MSENRYTGYYLSWIDLILNLLLGITAMFMLAVINMNVQKKTISPIEEKAEILIIMSWADRSNDDVDLWIQDPDGRILSYRTRQTGFLTLDHDDMGFSIYKQTTESGESSIPYRREVAAVRRKIEGRYIVNVHMFQKRDPEPVVVTIESIQVNPYRVLIRKTITFSATKEEITVYGFDIDKNEIITAVNSLEYYPLFYQTTKVTK